MQLEVSPRFLEKVLVLDCTGRMVASQELIGFRDFMKQLVLGADAVVVNLEGVTYMDSGGLAVLVAVYTTARCRGATMKLASLNPTVKDLLRITKLLEVFETYASVDDAIGGVHRMAV